MSNEFCSPFNCNVCLMLEAYQKEDEIHLRPSKKLQFLLTCSGCQLVKYCNTQHQKLDWPIHRQFCQAVQKIKRDRNVSHPFYIAGVPRSKEEMEKTIVQLKYLLRNYLDRSLEYHEEELSSFPLFCGKCFKFKNLKVVCTKCNSQIYCTDQHRELHAEEHAEVCSLLEIYYCPFKVQPTKEFYVQFTGKIKDLHNLNLVECIQKTFSISLPLKPCQTIKNYQLFSWAADFSCIMTICYVLNALRLQKLDSTKFNIFVLGASVEAILWFREIHCKFFFLQNPEIKELVLYFIGPEVVEPAFRDMKFSFLDSQRLVNFKIYKGLFQDYCKYHKVKPSLITVFNCGFSEFSYSSNFSLNITSLGLLGSAGNNINVKDTWLEGLRKILKTVDTPIIFTSYTEQESQFDFAALQNAATKQNLKVHIDRILKISKNPFGDLRPLRQWYSHDREEFYCRNGYIQAVRTKLEV